MELAYNITWDMCTDEMKAKLKAVNNFVADIKENMDVLLLLKEIRKIMYNFQDKRYVQHNMLMTWNKFYGLKQQPNETVQEYYDRFKLQVKVVESVGGSFGRDDQLLSNAGLTVDDSTMWKDIKEKEKVAKEKYLAYKFIYNADHQRYRHTTTRIMRKLETII